MTNAVVRLRPEREAHRIDCTDLQILSLLQGNGRLTNSRLALEVGLSESACFNRVRRLEQNRVIEGYHAVISQSAFGGFITVLVDVILESHKYQSHARFEQLVRSIPQIVECIAMTGSRDYLLRMVARDMEEYAAIMERLTEQHGQIAQFFSNVMMKPVKQQTTFVPVSGTQDA
jgi:Lrp/AsnC family transcriptional regulator, regulator of ectoine-degradation genes